MLDEFDRTVLACGRQILNVCVFHLDVFGQKEPRSLVQTGAGGPFAHEKFAFLFVAAPTIVASLRDICRFAFALIRRQDLRIRFADAIRASSKRTTAICVVVHVSARSHRCIPFPRSISKFAPRLLCVETSPPVDGVGAAVCCLGAARARFVVMRTIRWLRDQRGTRGFGSADDQEA